MEEVKAMLFWDSENSPKKPHIVQLLPKNDHKLCFEFQILKTKQANVSPHKQTINNLWRLIKSIHGNTRLNYISVQTLAKENT